MDKHLAGKRADTIEPKTKPMDAHRRHSKKLLEIQASEACSTNQKPSKQAGTIGLAVVSETTSLESNGVTTANARTNANANANLVTQDSAINDEMDQGR